MILAFDIGGSRIRAARGGVALGEVATPLHDAQAFVGALHGFLRGDETGVAISIAGVVAPETGQITVANIPCINGRALAAELQAALGLPVLVLNDADCFALAEIAVGAARGHRNVFALILGSGVGGGLVIDGRVVQGAGGYAGEWGHGPVIRDPVFVCGCGQKGCLDTVGSAGRSCDFSRIGLVPLEDLFEVNDASLNVALFLPLGVALALISNPRRKFALMFAAIALPFGIEALQLWAPILARGCESADVIDNLSGMAVGFAGATVLRRLARPSPVGHSA